MTFKEIAIKNFRGNMRRYLSYFICNSFSIMIIFMFSTLIFNEKFSKSSIIEKGVMSTFVVPGVALIFFSIVFVSYSHIAFIKYRKKEFGLFMILGLSNRDIRKLILIENGIIALTSILAGIISGVIFSPLFFLIVARLINITGIPFSLNYKSFIVTIGLFTLIFAFLIFITEIITGDFEIVRLLKEDRTSSKNKIINGKLALTGVGILIGSLVFLFILYRAYEYDRGRALLICTISCLIGLYITISQLGSILIRLTKKKKTYYKNLFLVTSLDYKFKQTKKIVFIVAIMVMVTIFYTSFSLYWFSSAEKIAAEDNPYHIAFVQNQEINNISTERINNLVYTKENPVIEHKTIEFVEVLPLEKYRQSKFLLCEDKLNELSKIKFHVNNGEYIKLVFYDYPDKDMKKRYYEPELTLSTVNGVRKYKCEKEVYKMLFNGSNYFEHNVIVLNSYDYNKVRSDGKNIKLGKVQLFNFKDWKKTKNIETKLKEESIICNGNRPYSGDDNYYAIANYYNCFSKIGLYNYYKQGGGISFFLSVFIGVFFFIATLIVLFLRLYSEIEDEKRKYKKIFKIGITEKEIRKNISKELGVLFFVPPVIGIIIGTVYLCCFASADGGVELGVFKEILLCDFIMSTAYLVFQGVYYFIARKRYCDEIIESLC